MIQITQQLIQDVDFREAATIIQQTSQIFAKKVDYLYEQTNQILISQPGKQRKRRTLAVQAQDLILDYDIPNNKTLLENQQAALSKFFDVISPDNPKITQKNNLYLLPKNPHTMLSARRVIENQDIRITPIANAIIQDNTLVLEQWDVHELQLVLDQNANMQPINHSTPVHPRYFQQMSTVLTESMRRSGLLFGSQMEHNAVNVETIQLAQPDLEQRPEISLPNGDSPVAPADVSAHEEANVQHIQEDESININDLDYQEDNQQPEDSRTEKQPATNRVFVKSTNEMIQDFTLSDLD